MVSWQPLIFIKIFFLADSVPRSWNKLQSVFDRELFRVLPGNNAFEVCRKERQKLLPQRLLVNVLSKISDFISANSRPYIPWIFHRDTRLFARKGLIVVDCLGIVSWERLSRNSGLLKTQDADLVVRGEQLILDSSLFQTHQSRFFHAAMWCDISTDPTRPLVPR